LLPPITSGPESGGDDRADLLRRCAGHIVESAAGRPLVLSVDDAHLLDDLSATLVHQMAVTGAALVVATLRSGEPAPDPVVALWKDDAVERLELSGLDAGSVEELLLAVLGGPVDRGTVHRLAIGSQGNVLFLRELVLGALDDGSLGNDVGIWRLTGPLSPSSRLSELVETRLAGLTPAERNLLEVLAFGEPLGAAELRLLGDPALAEGLERRGLLSCRNEGRRLDVRLGHSLYADVIRNRTPALRAREVARLLADTVEATGARRREDVLRVGTWRLAGGTGDPQLMYEAACLARWRYDFPLAERLAVAAVQAGGGFDAALLVAQLASLQGRGDEAEQLLVALADEASDDRQRGLVACTRLDNLVFHMGHIDAGLAMAEEAEGGIADPAWRDELAAKRAAIIDGQYGPRAGASVALPLLERGEGRAFVWASIITAYSTARMGRLDEARAIAERGYQAHQALTEPFDWHPWTHTFFRAEALTHEGRFAEARHLTTEQYQRALDEKSPEAQAWFAWQLAKTAADCGSPRTAAVHGRTAVAHFRQLGQPQFESFALGALAQAEALSGDAGAAAAALARLDALGLPPVRYYGVDLVVARAWAMVAARELPAAIVLLKEAIDLGEGIGDLVGAASARHTLARLGHAAEVVDGLAALAGSVQGDLMAARAAHAAELVANNQEALTEVSDRFEAMGAVLLAAEAAADSAVAWRRWGDPRRAARAEQRANALATSCENPVTPALLAIKSRSRLTQAERETALLAASGRSNKEIAAQLGISVRTVENHLQHVYEKLGISARTDLPQGLEHAY
jgi:DNA-binding CsgD family transcriptional regulator